MSRLPAGPRPATDGKDRGSRCAPSRLMLMIKEGPLRVRDAYKYLTGLSFPRRFPIIQFPNLPLIIAFLAGQASMFLHGSPHPHALAVSYLAMTCS